MDMSRRGFLGLTGGGLAAVSTGCGTRPIASAASVADLRPAQSDVSAFGPDPWIEIDRAAFRHNVREVSRLAGGRPILAVVKNNAYGLGDHAVGPLLAGMPEVGGIACVRVHEALAMRDAGVTKPIVNMAEVSEPEMEELARADVASSVWLDDAPRRVERVARRLGRPVRIQLFVDTGMNREGMPYRRAGQWIETLCTSRSADVRGTYTMFGHELDFNRVQFPRFERLIDDARASGLDLGILHAAPTFEVFHFPEAHLDMVRPGNALFGNYPDGEGVREMADLRTVFRLRARVVRVERLEPGETAGFGRAYTAARPTWIALLPVGRTDGYPSTAVGTCEVLINGRLYPVVAGVNSAHAMVEIGSEKTVEVGDIATLIGPDHEAISPHTVAERTGERFLPLLQSMNPRLPRRIV